MQSTFKSVILFPLSPFVFERKPIRFKRFETKISTIEIQRNIIANSTLDYWPNDFKGNEHSFYKWQIRILNFSMVQRNNGLQKRDSVQSDRIEQHSIHNWLNISVVRQFICFFFFKWSLQTCTILPLPKLSFKQNLSLRSLLGMCTKILQVNYHLEYPTHVTNCFIIPFIVKNSKIPKSLIFFWKFVDTHELWLIGETDVSEILI